MFRFEVQFLRKYFTFTNLPPQCHTVSLFIFNYSSVTLTPILRFECTKVLTLCTFASVLCVFACPLLGSSCTFSRPFSNHQCRSNTLDFVIAYSPYTTVIWANIFLALLTNFTQNLTFIHCPRFLPIIFPPHMYHGHVLRLLIPGKEDSFFLWLMQTQVGKCPNVLYYKNFLT